MARPRQYNVEIRSVSFCPNAVDGAAVQLYCGIADPTTKQGYRPGRVRLAAHQAEYLIASLTRHLDAWRKAQLPPDTD